jgi:hypothetical protein
MNTNVSEGNAATIFRELCPFASISLKITEMKFMRCTTRYSLIYHKGNTSLLDIYPVENKFEPYKNKWLNHINRMEGIIYQSNSLTVGRSTGRPPRDYYTYTIVRPK